MDCTRSFSAWRRSKLWLRMARYHSQGVRKVQPPTTPHYFQVTIALDGWEEKFEFEAEKTDASLHPIGFAHHTRTALQPPKGCLLEAH